MALKGERVKSSGRGENVGVTGAPGTGKDDSIDDVRQDFDTVLIRGKIPAIVR
jgi:putative protein kinase ArgK-like GTPase of G3E family